MINKVVDNQVSIVTQQETSHYRADWCLFRDQSRYVPSQWETLLHCNTVSHWLGAYLDWSLPITWQYIPWIMHMFFFFVTILLMDIRNDVIYLSVFFRVTSLALGQSYDCPSASEVTLKNMSKTYCQQTSEKTTKYKPRAYFSGSTLHKHTHLWPWKQIYFAIVLHKSSY